MLFGRVPFEVTGQLDIGRILARELEFPANVSVSDSAKDFMRRMMAKDRDSRLDVWQAAAHPWLSIV
jgi:hypothetical protein